MVTVVIVPIFPILSIVAVEVPPEATVGCDGEVVEDEVVGAPQAATLSASMIRQGKKLQRGICRRSREKEFIIQNKFLPKIHGQPTGCLFYRLILLMHATGSSA